MERNPTYTKRPRAAVQAQVEAMNIHARPDARPGYEFSGSLRGASLWLDGATRAEIKKQAHADLEICVDDVIRNRRRDDERIKAIIAPLIDFIVTEYGVYHLFLDLPLAQMHTGKCSFLGAALYGFDGGERMPEHREVLSLHFQVETPHEEDGEGVCSTTRVSFEVPKSLANEFNQEAAEAWMRTHNAALATLRLKRVAEATQALVTEQAAWNAVERRNS